MYSGVERTTTSATRPSGCPTRPANLRQINGNSNSAITPMATSATCYSTSVWITPGSACLVMIGHSQVPTLTQVAAANRSVPRNGIGTMSWVRKRTRLATRGAAADRLGQYQHADDDEDRHHHGSRPQATGADQDVEDHQQRGGL